MIAKAAGKELKYKLVDFHSSRPGHDLRFGRNNKNSEKTAIMFFSRYAISGDLLKTLGWTPKFSLEQRIQQFSEWIKNNPQWSDMTNIK